MTFTNIHNDTECNCLNKTVLDNTKEYVRKLRKDIVEDKDFLTHWERDIKPESEECEDICSYKAVSINQFEEDVQEQIIEKYKTTFTINPKKGAYYLKFKLGENAGRVQHTPEDDNPTHYNLFKSDTFTLKDLIEIETVKFA